MKQLYLLFFASLAIAACSEDDTVTSAAKKSDLTVTLAAGMTGAEPDGGSRAGYDGVKSTWAANDAIGVTFNADNTNLLFMQVEGSLSSDATRTIFSGTLENPIPETIDCVAYYPYSDAASISDKVIITEFPQTQTYVAGGYAGIPLFGSYSGPISSAQMRFRNLFSVVKLTLVKGASLTGTVNLKSIVLKGQNEETLSGDMMVDMSEATPSVVYLGGGTSVTLDCGAGVELTATPQVFHIAIPAISYPEGYSLTFVTENGQVTKTAKSAGANYEINTVYAAPQLTISSFDLVIPDPNFRDALAYLGLITILDPVAGTVSITQAGKTAASIDVSGKGIASLVGVENFPALATLSCNNNDIVALDLSKNPLLVNLDCSSNKLTSLTLGANTVLAHVNCSGNSLTTLNVSGNTALTMLNCSSNQLASLSLSANTLLANLNCSSNKLTSLGLSANGALVSLECYTNLLTSLDLRNNTLLTSVKCYGNTLSTLNISGLNLLSALYLNSSNNITALKLSIPANAKVQNFIADGVTGSLWTSFECVNNTTVQTISLKNNANLLSANVTGNTALTSFNVSGSTLMTWLTIYGSTLTTLDISKLKALTSLYLNSSGTNCINLLTMTIPTNATIRNLIANEALLVGTWTRFVCSANSTIRTISLQKNIGLLGVTVTNNIRLTTLYIAESGLGETGVIQSGNASGFRVVCE